MCVQRDGTGTIVVNVAGLPTGATTKIDLQGAHGEVQELTGRKKTVTTASDESTVTARLALGPADPVVRTASTRRRSTSLDFCLVSGAGTSTVNVTFAAIPTSNKLWMTNNSSAQLLGYGGGSLTTTGAPAASGRGTARACRQEHRLRRQER